MKLSDAFELFEDDDSNVDENEDLCPISKSKIVTKCTLPCNHSFEYSYLKPELKRQRTENRMHTSKCPYCRYSLKNYVLPFIECDDQVNGGKTLYNHEEYKRTSILPLFTCSYIAKSGKKKEKKCNCIAHRFAEGDYCYRHYAYIQKSKLKNRTSKRCCAITKNGEQCTKSVNFNIENNKEFYTHAKKYLKL